MPRQPPTIPNAVSLRAAALHYVARYATSSANLRRVLLRRVARAAQCHATLDAMQQAMLRAEIEQIVAACLDKKYLDDAAYAASLARRARAQGKSARLVTAQLQQRGLNQSQIAAALTAADAETNGTADDAAEYQAACRLARRKKLGIYRTTPADAAQRQRDFATLARAGFSRAIAQRALQQAADTEDF